MFNPEDYILSSQLFLQLLGVIYFFAFGAFLFQIRGLIGKNGILPIEHYLANITAYFKAKRFYIVPNVFWINASDAALYTVVGSGTFFSILLAFNVVPWLLLPLLFILYLSIVSVGQDFLSFGWEVFLLEITFNAIFLSWTEVPNIFIWMSLNLLLFRFHFQGGAVKLLSLDVNWRNLTACAYHYQSQPLPNTIAWYIYKFPMWFHKISTLLMFSIELIVPFGIFFNSPEVRLAVFICFFGLQFFIWFTGNFSYLNHLTAVLCIILVNDAYLSPLLGPINNPSPSRLWEEITLSIIGGALLLLQLVCLWNHFFKPLQLFQRCLSWVAPFHLVNRYGIFAVMTTKRYEIIVEGSDDGIAWKEYLFYHKASELSRRPRRISPYQPRIDWQAWFLPFTDYDSEPWFQNFLYRLLTGSPAVLALLRTNPFPDKPPKYIRAVAYDYEFTTWKEKKETGNWWEAALCARVFPHPFYKILTKESSMMHKILCFLALVIVFNLEGQPPPDPRDIRDFYKEYNYYGEPLNRQPRLHGEIDNAITENVRSTLLGDPSLSYDAQHISVETHNGNVTLRGHVEDLEERNRLTEIVTFINGVQSVDNRLQVSYGY